MSKGLIDRSGRLRLIAATFTAFDPGGAVNLQAIEAQAERLVRTGVDGAFICGSTGEGVSLGTEERIAIANRWCEVAGDDLLLVVHVGHTSLTEARRLAASAQAAGAHAVAALGPFYFPPADLDRLVAFCARIADAAPELPFVYYHIPELSHVAVAIPDFMRRAVEVIPTFSGVKFTHTDLVEMAASVDLAGERLEILNGPDELLLQALTIGVRSAVGSTYNVCPELYRSMFQDYVDGNLASARAWQARAQRIIEVGRRHGGMPAFKAMASIGGPELGPCRLPFADFDAGARTRLEADLDAEGLVEAVGIGGPRVAS